VDDGEPAVDGVAALRRWRHWSRGRPTGPEGRSWMRGGWEEDDDREEEGTRKTTTTGSCVSRVLLKRLKACTCGW
jgi:hypothetical protein